MKKSFLLRLIGMMNADKVAVIDNGLHVEYFIDEAGDLRTHEERPNNLDVHTEIISKVDPKKLILPDSCFYDEAKRQIHGRIKDGRHTISFHINVRS